MQTKEEFSEELKKRLEDKANNMPKTFINEVNIIFTDNRSTIQVPEGTIVLNIRSFTDTVYSVSMLFPRVENLVKIEFTRLKTMDEYQSSMGSYIGCCKDSKAGSNEVSHFFVAKKY